MRPVFDALHPSSEDTEMFLGERRRLPSVVDERQAHDVMELCVVPDLIPNFENLLICFVVERKSITDEPVEVRHPHGKKLQIRSGDRLEGRFVGRVDRKFTDARFDLMEGVCLTRHIDMQKWDHYVI